jgi:CRISPR/Cas system-associated protein Cas10 (large subunit of type III CRISPR-Cas system)
VNKYLHGASVQGIQDFIFKTNRLQEIVGASEIVKNIAEDFKKYHANEILINTAGNIKAVFHTREACKKVVLEFAKNISKKAYGITLSQAVVAFDGEAKAFINELETRLKTQRNKPSITLDSSINIMKLNPKTARPSHQIESDIATTQKLESYKSIEKDETYKEFKLISNTKNKLAVIHIDGNGLGKIVKQLGDKLSAFSVSLDNATRNAFDSAKKGKKIREIIIGGDDVTVICNANDALSFTKDFLHHFETETSKIQELKGIKVNDKKIDKLTACAGISYSNEKYPFHYAVDLAEALCGVAKNHSEREHSCLMFHNIQSSNYQSWDKFVEDELTINNDRQTIRCDFGAYYLNKEDEANILDFIHTLEAYRCDNSPISRLRNWLSELYRSDKNAKNLLDRINTIIQQNNHWNCEIMDKNLKFFDKNLSNDTLIIEKDGYKKTPIYDILQILSITDRPKADK